MHHLILVVLEQDLDVGSAFLVNGVLYEVLTVVVVADFTWNLSIRLRVGDLYLEGVAAGLSVLAFIVTRLNNEFNGFANSLLLKDTLTEAERLVSASVKEVGVVHEGGSEFRSKNRELDCAFLWPELDEAWSDSSELSL